MDNPKEAVMAEKIEVGYKEVIPESGYYHKYIVYTQNDGTQYYARGGPSTGLLVPAPMIAFGYVRTEYGEYKFDTIDFDSTNSHPRETIIEGNDLSTYWNSIKENMDSLNTFQYMYQPVGQNSNATVDDSLKRAGLPESTLDDIYKSPGSNSPFSIFYGDPLNAIKGLLPPWLTPVGGLFNDVPAIPILRGGGDPLVMDLDGDGVEVSRLGYGTGASTVYFDMDNDGFAERTSWATGGDGLLALDKNGNGKIDNQGELFGDTDTLPDGFTNLKQYDSNNDNKMTSADAQWANLRVWVDADNDHHRCG